MTLTVPRQYTALAGDLLVVFTAGHDTPLNNTDWYIDVIESRDNKYLSTLTTVDIPGGYSDGEVRIGCGVIDAAGQLVVRLVDSTTSDVVAQSNVIDVAWPPSVRIRVPDSHKALSEDLTVTLSVSHIACQSQQSHVFYTVELVYLGLNTSSSGHSSVVFTHTLSVLSSTSSPIIISCSVLDRAGFYQAVLTSSRRTELPVAVSNVLAVDWSHVYSLSLSSVSKSCRQHVIVRHTQPRCHDLFYTLRVLVRQLPSNNNNNNRVLERVSDDVTSRDWRYVSERRVRSSRTSVTFDCSLFQRDAQHCVLLLSTASDDTEHVHQRYCTTSPTHTYTGEISFSSSCSWAYFITNCLSNVTFTERSNKRHAVYASTGHYEVYQSICVQCRQTDACY